MAVSMSVSEKITSHHENWRENMCMLTLQYGSIQHWPYVKMKWNNVFQNKPKLMAYRKMAKLPHWPMMPHHQLLRNLSSTKLHVLSR
jgi:hypothetical protein